MLTLQLLNNWKVTAVAAAGGTTQHGHASVVLPVDSNTALKQE
jgi:hypothetical protein